MLAVIGAVREIIGSGSLFGFEFLSDKIYTKNLLMVSAPGAFIVLGFLIAAFNAINARKAAKSAKPAGGK